MVLSLGISLIYYFSNLKNSPYDYTLRVAHAMLGGQVGLSETPPSWLNEFVPLDDRYYSVFPFGAVLTLLPHALLNEIFSLDGYESRILVSLIAAGCSILFFLICSVYFDDSWKRVLYTSAFMLGTWGWCNSTFGGAWQTALFFSILGQLGSIYFIFFRRKYFLGGIFFALAFGNRTEVLLTAPIYIHWILRDFRALSRGNLGKFVYVVAKFSVAPFLLGVVTLWYNYLRFGSVLDFGYARIPGVLQEPWYKFGIFSLSAIPGNFKAMLLDGWKHVSHFPYLTPTGFGGSIFLSSPFLLLLFISGAKNPYIKRSSWIAVALLTFLLWCHGNTGGWQYSYRYGMVLIPWFFLILIESASSFVTKRELWLIIISILINAYVTYLFHYTSYVHV